MGSHARWFLQKGGHFSPSDTEQDPVGYWAQEPFCVPPSRIQEIGFIQPPRPSLSSKGQIQAAVKQGRDGTLGTKEEESRATGVQPWGRVLVPCQQNLLHIVTRSNIFELFCKCWNPYQAEEDKTVCCPQAQSPDQLNPEGSWRWLPLILPPTNEKKVYKLIWISLNHEYKTPL